MTIFDKFKQWLTKSEDGSRKPMKIQSLIFDKQHFTQEKATAWARSHGYRSGVDETGESYRMRQADPSKYDKMRTIDITTGIKAVVGKSRIGKSSPTSSQVHVPTPMGEREKITIKSKSGHTIEIAGKEHDPDNLKELKDSFNTFIDEEGIEKDKLDTHAREHISENNFAIPSERRYPIHDIEHARNALARSSGKPEEAKVRSAVYRKYPSLDKTVHKSDARRVAKIAVRHGSKVLMGKRRDNGKWTFPGGHCEPYETMKEGALRELNEETGIEADPKCLYPMKSDQLKDRHGKPLHVSSWSVTFDGDRPPTSMKQDPDAEVHKWQWVDIDKGLPEYIACALHVPTERCNVMQGLGMSVSKSVAVDVDDDLDMYPGIDNLEGGLLKSDEKLAAAAMKAVDDNETDEDGIDLQRLVEGMDWEMNHTTKDESMAQEAAMEQLREDPNHYRKLQASADGSDDVLTKDTGEGEEDPFAGEGYNLDLGSGQTREDGHVGIDLYPYDYGTVIWDLNMGIPFPDASCKSVRMVNSLEHMDGLADDPKPLLSEIHRVLMPGGQFIYEGPNEIYNYQEWRDCFPGFVLVNHEEHVGKYTQPENSIARQQFLRIASPDPATANDAEPRIGVSQLDQLPADQLLAMDAMSYYYSDATSSGRGNRLHGYPSQGALSTGIHQRQGSASKSGYMPLKKDQTARAADDSNNPTTQEVRAALRPKRNPNPAPPERMTRKSAVIEKVLKSGRIVPIIKANNEKQIVYGVVLAPNEIDSQDDFMEPEEIEKAAHKYLLQSRVIGSEHSKAIQADPVESFIAPQDFEVTDGQYGPQPVKKGSWVLGIKVTDPDEWQKIKSGEYTGFSVGGFGLRHAE